jgi:hypothetical protein
MTAPREVKVLAQRHRASWARLCCGIGVVAMLGILPPDASMGNSSALRRVRSASTGKASGPEIYDRARDLMKSGNFSRCLPLFRRILVDPPQGTGTWQVRVMYSEALNGAAFQAADRLGIPGPQQSWSTRRIALIREAAAQLDTAEQSAPPPEAVAIIRYLHGHLLEVWGFPMDAYGWYRAALNANRACGDAMIGLMRTDALLRDSTRTPE